MPDNVMPGPCVLCGTTDYPLSVGGPSVCPACDCGNFDDVPLAAKRVIGLAPPPTTDERRAAFLACTLSLAGVPFARVVDGEPTAMDGSPLPDGDVRHPAKT